MNKHKITTSKKGKGVYEVFPKNDSDKQMISKAAKQHDMIEVNESIELGEGKAWDDIVDINKKHQAKKIHGVLVDAQTAGLLVQIHNALEKSNNKKTFIDTINKDRRGLEKIVDFAWSQVK